MNYHYRYFDKVLNSNCAIPELESVPAELMNIRFELREPRRDFPDREWFHSWHSDSMGTQVACTIAQDVYLDKGRFRLRVPDQADFLIKPELTF